MDSPLTPRRSTSWEATRTFQIARASVCNLILGKQPGKVYNNLRAVSARMKERF